MSKAAWGTLSRPRAPCGSSSAQGGQPGIPPRPASGHPFICRQHPKSQTERLSSLDLTKDPGLGMEGLEVNRMGEFDSSISRLINAIS